MSPGDKQEIAKLIQLATEATNPAIQPQANVKGLIDGMMKVVSAVSLAVIMFIGNTVIELRDKVTILEVKFEGVQEFTKKPRFTEQDFNQKIEPILQELQAVRASLNKRELWMEKKDDEIDRIDLEIQQIKNDLKK